MSDMKKIFVIGSVSLLGVSLLIPTLLNRKAVETNAYSTSSLPTTIYLNDTAEANVRSYYSSLNSLSVSERQGTNLLKNLKPILKNGQKYYSYDSTSAIWQIYEISDRDWEKSPASSTTYGTYDSKTNVISNYQYGTSASSSKNNPYIHALYVDRNVNNLTTAWDDHQQTQWGINREHVWPKSAGFEASGQGGARGDPMHLMAGNGRVNGTEHNNFMYGFVDSNHISSRPTFANLINNYRGTSVTLGGSDDVFEPQDSDKGDIARALFYMVARYNYLSGSDSDGINQNNPNLELVQESKRQSSTTSSTSKTGKQGILTDLLEWNRIDPPDEFEIHRNNLLYTNYTKNRNPFIDFPEWAEYIWGSAVYDGKELISYSSAATGYANPTSDTLNNFSSSVSGSVTASLDSASITVGQNIQINAVSSDESTISWSTSNSSIVSISSSSSASGSNITLTGVNAGSATITASATIGGTLYTDECEVTVTASSATLSPTIARTDYAEGYAAEGTSGTITKSIVSSNDLSISYSGINTKSSKDNPYSYTMYVGNQGYIYSTSCPNGYYPSSIAVHFSSSTGTSGNIGISYGTSALTSRNTSVSGTVTRNGTYTIENPIGNNKYWNISTRGGNVQISSIDLVYAPESAATKTLSSISVDTTNVTTEFIKNSEFDSTGLVVIAHYDDSTSSEVTPDSIVAPDLSSLGEKTVTVNYGGKSTSYKVNVVPKPVTEIVASISKTSYKVGETINKSDITVYDADNLEEPLDDFTFADDGYQFTYDDAASGGAATAKEFEVRYGSVSTTISVNVSREAYSEVPADKTDTLNRALTNVSGTTYKDWSGLSVTGGSGAVYAGNSAGGNDSIQLRSATDKPASGIITTTSGGKVSSVTVAWDSHTTNGRILDIYGKNTPYSTVADLRSAEPDDQGTLLGSIIYRTSTTLNITGSYTYIGLKSRDGAMYLTSIQISFNSTTTVSNLANYIMFEDTANQCNTKLPTALDWFQNKITKAERNTLMTSEDYVYTCARNRLCAWATEKGKTIVKQNDDYVVNGAGKDLSPLENKSIIIPVVSILGAITVTIVGIYIFKKKKKIK